MSSKFDINNFVVDKVKTIYVGYNMCYICGFDNIEKLHECPVCKTKLILDKTTFKVDDYGGIKE